MKLLITGAWSCTSEQLDFVKNKGHEIIFMQNESDALPEGARCAQGVICNALFVHHEIQQFKNLKYIQLTSAGFDRAPMDYIQKHSIAIYNARGVYSIPMAEYAVSGTLQLYKQGSFFAENQRLHNWQKHRGLLELYGKNVLIVGCGSVGTECAKRFSAFGCNVYGIDLYPSQNEHYQEIAGLERLNEKLMSADVVVLTLPLTNNTKGLFDELRFSYMKKASILVNISRGGIICEHSLIQALKTRLFGAVLDVFEKEPLAENSPLWDMENVIITPHNSFDGEGNNERLWNVINNNLGHI